jgi:hypothetical protein
MKIAIAFFGLPRCSEKSFPSIKQKIFANIPKDAEYKCFYHFYKQKEVISSRSNEQGELHESNYAPFQNYEGILEKPEDVLPALPIEELKQFGDAWKNDFGSMQNLLLQLHSLKQVTKLVENYEPDCVFYVRPDLIYHDPIPGFYYNLAFQTSNCIFLPKWQWGIGVNDRFALLNKESYQAYGNRIDEAINYCKSGPHPLHSERLLKYALLKKNVNIYILDAQASRVRVNGDIVNEKFKTNISFTSPLTNKYKRFLFLTQLKTKLKLRGISK